MQHFASSRMLGSLSRESKLIYTAFCVFALAALVVSVFLYEDLLGPTRVHGWDRIRQYYTHLQVSPLKTQSSPRTLAGPQVELPEEMQAAPASLTVVVPTRKLLETTHFHLFTLPIFLLVLTHLFVLTPTAPRWRLVWTGSAWVCGMLHVAAPWVLRVAGEKAIFLFVGSGMGLFVTSAWMALYSIASLWQPIQQQNERK